MKNMIAVAALAAVAAVNAEALDPLTAAVVVAPSPFPGVTQIKSRFGVVHLTAVKVQNTLKRLKSCFLAITACGAFGAAGVTLPVCEVAERAQRESAVYPGRVVPVAQVDVVP